MCLDKITKPLKCTNSEEELLYSKEMLAIKNEINKDYNIDFELIKNTSIYYLSNKANDFRVFCYLIFAFCFKDDISSIADIFALFNEFIVINVNAVPIKNSLRQKSIKWLQSNRIKSILKDKINKANNEDLSKLLHSINALNSTLIEKFNDRELNFDFIIHFINDKKLYLEKILPQEQYQDQNVVVYNKNVKEVKAENTLINSLDENNLSLYFSLVNKKELENIVEHISKHYLDKQEFYKAMNISRLLRWSNIKIPCDKSLKTPFPSLSENYKKSLYNALDENNSLQVIDECEKLFLIPGGHLTLDLQYYCYHAASKLNYENEKSIIIFWLKFLLKKYPNILKYKFIDDTFFIENKFHLWVKNVCNENFKTSEMEYSIQGTEDNFLQKIIHYVESNCDFESSLIKIDKMKTKTAKDNLKQQVARFVLCIKHHSYDLSLKLYDHIENIIDKYRLYEWEPELCVQIYYLALNNFPEISINEKIIVNVSNDIKSAYELKHKLLKKLSWLDFGKAVNFYD